MIEYIKGTLYSCVCGYNTLSSKHACKHSKTKKCNGKTMEKRDVEFVLKEDHLAALSGTPLVGNTTIYNTTNTDNSSHVDNSIDNSTHTVNINLTLPERTTKEDFVEYLRELDHLGYSTERIMGKKKAIQTYTHEAVDALCLQPPANGVTDFLETERGDKRTKMSLQDAAKLRVTNPRGYHQGVPDDVKFRHQKIESHTEKALDKITNENKTNGFL